jgi:hypothetical protein
MVRFTKHAREAISVREIAADWIEAALSAPDWTEPDPRHPDRTRSYIRQSLNMPAAFCGLCIDERAMIS